MIGQYLLADYQARADRNDKLFLDSLPEAEQCSEKNIRLWKQYNKQRRDQESKQITLAYKILNSIIVGSGLLGVILVLGGLAAFTLATSIGFGMIFLALVMAGLFLFLNQDFLKFFITARKLSYRISERIHPLPDMPDYQK